MARKRDLSAAQFLYACKREGFRPEGFLGFFSLGGTAAAVSVLNTNSNRRRDWLNYLRRERDRFVREKMADDAAALAMAYHKVVV